MPLYESVIICRQDITKNQLDIIISEIKKNGFHMAAICEGIYNDPKKISKNIKKLNDIWNEN